MASNGWFSALTLLRFEPSTVSHAQFPGQAAAQWQGIHCRWIYCMKCLWLTSPAPTSPGAAWQDAACSCWWLPFPPTPGLKYKTYKRPAPTKHPAPGVQLNGPGKQHTSGQFWRNAWEKQGAREIQKFLVKKEKRSSTLPFLKCSN